MMLFRENFDMGFRQVGDGALKVIFKWEKGPGGDFAKVPYVCPSGYRTIGWGHKLLPKDNFSIPMTRAKALEVLDKDLDIFEEEVDRLVKVPLTNNQFDALVCLCFNIGGTAFKRSTLLRLLNEGDYEGASSQFGRWRRGRDRDGNSVIMKGLVNRRADETELFNTP